MNVNRKFTNILLSINFYFFYSIYAQAEEEEIYLKSISDQIQVITKDLKTLEKAVYQKSDIASISANISSDGLNEDILTKHLLKLNEIEVNSENLQINLKKLILNWTNYLQELPKSNQIHNYDFLT